MLKKALLIFFIASVNCNILEEFQTSFDRCLAEHDAEPQIILFGINPSNQNNPYAAGAFLKERDDKYYIFPAPTDFLSKHAECVLQCGCLLNNLLLELEFFDEDESNKHTKYLHALYNKILTLDSDQSSMDIKHYKTDCKAIEAFGILQNFMLSKITSNDAADDLTKLRYNKLESEAIERLSNWGYKDRDTDPAKIIVGFRLRSNSITPEISPVTIYNDQYICPL